MGIKRNSKLMCVKSMPPLRHSAGDKKFDITKSKACQWLIRQPDVLNYVFDKVREEKLIAYDLTTGTWQGIDYQAPCPHGYDDWDECPDCCH